MLKRLMWALASIGPSAGLAKAEAARLSGDAIAAAFSDVTVVSGRVWDAPIYFDPNGEVRGSYGAFNPPSTRLGQPEFEVYAWRVEENRLCVDHAVFSGGCFVVTEGVGAEAGAYVLHRIAPPIAGAPTEYVIRVADGNAHGL